MLVCGHQRSPNTRWPWHASPTPRRSAPSPPAASAALHRAGSTFAVPWNVLRTYGPVLRFDQHPLPKGEHPGIGCGSAPPRRWLRSERRSSSTAPSTVASRFSTSRACASRARWWCLTWRATVPATGRPARQERLRCRAPSTATQQWARAICAAFPDLDGICYNSRFTGMACVALYASRICDARTTIDVTPPGGSGTGRATCSGLGQARLPPCLTDLNGTRPGVALL